MAKNKKELNPLFLILIILLLIFLFKPDVFQSDTRAEAGEHGEEGYIGNCAEKAYMCIDPSPEWSGEEGEFGCKPVCVRCNEDYKRVIRTFEDPLLHKNKTDWWWECKYVCSPNESDGGAREDFQNEIDGNSTIEGELGSFYGG